MTRVKDRRWAGNERPSSISGSDTVRHMRWRILLVAMSLQCTRNKGRENKNKKKKEKREIGASAVRAKFTAADYAARDYATHNAGTNVSPFVSPPTAPRQSFRHAA